MLAGLNRRAAADWRNAAEEVDALIEGASLRNFQRVLRRLGVSSRPELRDFALRSALDAARAEASEARGALEAQRRAERSLARSLYSELEEQVGPTSHTL